MEWLWILLGVVAAIFIVCIVWYVLTARAVSAADERVTSAWRTLESHVRERSALLAPVIDMMREKADHEEPLYRELTGASQRAEQATGPSELSAAENDLQAGMRRLFTLASGYPQLASSPEYLKARSAIQDADNHIQADRRFYNGSVREFNAKVGHGIGRSVARSKGVGEREFFEFADRAAIAEPPRIQF